MPFDCRRSSAGYHYWREEIVKFKFKFKFGAAGVCIPWYVYEMASRALMGN